MSETNNIDTSLYVQPIRLENLGFRAKCTFESQGRRRSFSAQIAAENDGQIYAKILGVGIITVAEGMVQPDRILVVDRIHRKVYDKDYDYLQNLIGVNVDFSILQSLIWATLPAHLEGQVVEDGGSAIITTQPADNVIAEYTIDTSKKRWTELTLDIKNEEVEGAHMLLENFTNAGPNIAMPALRTVEIRTKKEVQKLVMKLDRFLINQKKQKSLKIPMGYEMVN